MAQWDLPPHKRNSSLIYVGGKQRGDIHNKWVSKELGTKKGQIGKSPISNSKIILLLNLALRLPELGLLVFVSNLQRFMTGESGSDGISGALQRENSGEDAKMIY